MNTPKYIAITSGALLINEFEQLLPVLQEANLDAALLEESRENRFMKVKTEAARKRIITEIKRRVYRLPKHIWSFYETSSYDQRRILLFFIVLKSYEITQDFQLEVILNKWKRLERKIDVFDLQMRMDVLTSSNSEIESWSSSTKLKVITVFLRCLREVGLLKSGKLQKLPEQPPEFWKYFIEIDEGWFLEACLLSKVEREGIS
jgi:hypothetical protein